MEYRGVFTIGQKENFRYNYFVSQKRSLMSCLIVFVLILLLNAFLRYSYGMTQSLVSGLLYSLPMAVGGAALLLLIHLLNMYLRLRGLYKQRKLEPFTQDILMNREGLHAASARGNVDLPWKNISLVRELGFPAVHHGVPRLCTAQGADEKPGGGYGKNPQDFAQVYGRAAVEAQGLGRIFRRTRPPVTSSFQEKSRPCPSFA